MRSLKAIVLAAAVAFPAMHAATAQAELVVHDWTLDLRGVDGLPNTPTYVINGIDAIGFNDAPVHAVTNDANADGLPTPGENFTVDGRGNASEFKNNTTGTIAVPHLNFPGTLAGEPGFEVTFAFHVNGTFIAANQLNFNFVHNDGGTLDIFVDNLTNGGTKATPGTGAGFTDGVQIASFALLPGEGGVFNVLTRDGSDDATFSLASALPGVILDASGNDLTLGSLLALTDSNFDADPNNTGGFGLQTGGFACGAGPTNFCALEDGTVRIAAVPEPGTLGLMGLSLVGFAFWSRRYGKQPTA